jgi:hypothetical protein
VFGVVVAAVVVAAVVVAAVIVAAAHLVRNDVKENVSQQPPHRKSHANL